MAVQNPSPQARLRLRHLRYPELDKWRIFEIAASLPLLVQLSLGLFFVGLCYFTASVHASIGYTTLPLVAGWAFCFITVTILPLFFPRCPYRTTLLKSFIGPFNRVVGSRLGPWAGRRLHLEYARGSWCEVWKLVRGAISSQRLHLWRYTTFGLATSSERRNNSRAKSGQGFSYPGRSGRYSIRR